MCVYIYIYTDTSRYSFVLNTWLNIKNKQTNKTFAKLKSFIFLVLLITLPSYLLLSGRSYISNLFFCLILFLYNSPKTLLLSESLRNEPLTSSLASCDPLPPAHLKSFAAHISLMCIYIAPSSLPP